MNTIRAATSVGSPLVRRESMEPAVENTTSMLPTCLLAAVFAAVAIVLLSAMGLLAPVGAVCTPCEGVYAACEMWQDARSLLSFALGTATCRFLCASRSSCPDMLASEDENAEKTQFSACLL